MNNYDKFKRGIEESNIPENKAKKIVDKRRNKISKIVFSVLLGVSLIIFVGLLDLFGKAFANAFYGAFGCMAIAGCLITVVVSILKLVGLKPKKLCARTIFYMVLLCTFIVLFMQIISTVNIYKALPVKSFKAYLDACFLHGRNNAGGALFGIVAYPFLNIIGSVTSLCVIAVLFFGSLLLCFRSFFYIESKQTIEWEDSEGGGMYIETIDGAKKNRKNENEFSLFHPNNLSDFEDENAKDEDVSEAEIEYSSAPGELLNAYMNHEVPLENRQKTAEEILFMSEDEWKKVFKKKESKPEGEAFASAIKTGDREPFQTGFSTETAKGLSLDTMQSDGGKQTIESAYNIYKEGGLTAEELLFGNIIDTPDLTYDELYPKNKNRNKKQEDEPAINELFFDGKNNEASESSNVNITRNSTNVDERKQNWIFEATENDNNSSMISQNVDNRAFVSQNVEERTFVSQNENNGQVVPQDGNFIEKPNINPFIGMKIKNNNSDSSSKEEVNKENQISLQNSNFDSFNFSTPTPDVMDTRNAIYDESLDLGEEDETHEVDDNQDFLIRSQIVRPEENEVISEPKENPFGTVYRVFDEPETKEDKDDLVSEPQTNENQSLITKPQNEVKKEKPKPEKKVARPYQAPSLGLLSEPDPPQCNVDFAAFYHTIEEAFKTYEMPVRVIAHTRGPTFTLYAVQLGSGVYFKRVMSREEDINRKLCCEQPISIVPNVKNMDAIGIEVFSRETRSVVPLKRYLVSEKYKKDKKLFFPIGIDVYGDAYYCDIFGAPHMLIGGTTGSGKSICINTIICTILYNYTPEYVKLILIDPKTVELAAFATVPHSLLGRTINNTADSVKALAWAVGEMERRYDIMAESQMKNISSYNDYMKEKKMPTLPYIVIVIDELADLMLSDKKNAPDLEKNINILTAKSRACGIHLILATQRPSKEIVTGLIKNNVATRIAFTMGDVVASKVILDRGGAEKLYGKGDLLYSSPEYAQPLRLQAPFVSENEVNEITDTVKANNDLIVDENIVNAIFNDKPTPAELMIDNSSDTTPKSSASELREKNFEETLKEVIVFAVRQGAISISKIQRQFGIGFLKAGNIVDRMEEMGIVGPAIPGSSKPRDVLITMADLPNYIGDIDGN